MQFVAAGQHGAQRAFFRPRLIQHFFRDGRGNERERDFSPGEPCQKFFWRKPRFFVGNMDARARRQIRPQLPDRRIKGGCGDLRRAVGGRHGIGALMPRDEIGQARVFDLDALGLAGRAGRVDDVGEIP